MILDIIEQHDYLDCFAKSATVLEHKHSRNMHKYHYYTEKYFWETGDWPCFLLKDTPFVYWGDAMLL